ncbi:MAG: CDP-alcohol phosphatidyltransferase family protein [Nitrospirae bacterium]|nr:CDP-alcohol phosphatidyltransferase family protein [Nitrospirota bacterium]
MNIPNLLTVVRILLVPIFVDLIVYGYSGWALLVFLGAGLTDALDGMIARVLDQRTTLGRYLDPLADKLLLVTAFVVLSIVGVIPIWVTIIVVSRDVIISIGTLVIHLLRERVNIMPTLMGKATTVAQLVYVVAALLGMTTPMAPRLVGVVLAVTLGLTIVSGLHYMFRGIRMLGGGEAT